MELIKYNAARLALEKCVRVDEVKVIRDKAEAMRAYAVQANDHEMETWAAEIKLRAQRRIGELSKALEKGHGVGIKGRTKSPPGGLLKKHALKAAGLKPQAANRCEKLAEIPEAEFEAYIAERKEKQQPASNKEIVAKVLRRTRRKANDERLKVAGEANGRTWKVTEIQDPVQCAALITDPPYGILDEPWEPQQLESFTRGWLNAWASCGADSVAIFWSQRFLWDGRKWFDESLAGYVFQQLLVWHYPNNKSPQSRDGFKQTWEPIFFYRRADCTRKILVSSSEWGKDLTDFDCCVAAVPQTNFNDAEEKRHPAQKPVSVMRWLINALTLPGEMVADPFCGSGTTGIAAVQLQRMFHGVESDGYFLKLARQRINTYGQTI